MRCRLAAALFACGLGAACAADGPQGVWDRDDGRGGVRIYDCGAALCGDIAWLRDAGGPGRVGERVLFDMKRTAADTWSGTAHNPEDGQDYAGAIILADGRLLTRGCLFGGLICKSVGLSRGR